MLAIAGFVVVIVPLNGNAHRFTSKTLWSEADNQNNSSARMRERRR
jgi:hypothetical protein